MVVTGSGQLNTSLDYPRSCISLTCLDHATFQANKTASHQLHLNDLPVQAHSGLGASDSPPSSQHEIVLPL